jgi:hypothetical protein
MFFGFAQYETDRWLVPGLAQPVIHDREIEIHFTGMFRRELFHLEIDHHETPESEVVEEKVEVIFATFDLKQVLSPYKRESHPQLEKEFLNMIYQTLLKIPLPRFWIKRQEPEYIGIFECLKGEV